MRINFTLNIDIETFANWLNEYIRSKEGERIKYSQTREGEFLFDENVIVQWSESRKAAEIFVPVLVYENGKPATKEITSPIVRNGHHYLELRTIYDIITPIHIQIVSSTSTINRVRVSAECEPMEGFDYFLILMKSVMKNFPESYNDIGLGLGVMSASEEVLAPDHPLFELWMLLLKLSRENLNDLSTFYLNVEHDRYSQLEKSGFALRLARKIEEEKLYLKLADFCEKEFPYLVDEVIGLFNSQATTLSTKYSSSTKI